MNGARLSGVWNQKKNIIYCFLDIIRELTLVVMQDPPWMDVTLISGMKWSRIKLANALTISGSPQPF